MNITSTAHGKIILTGEHAVIRGTPAIVVPNLNQPIQIDYDATKPTQLICDHDKTAWVFEHHWPKLWQMGQAILGKTETPLEGQLTISNQIPIARGCGFSAALSVVTAKLLCHVYQIKSDLTTLFDLSLHFENHFHGLSSGADIAGALASSPIWFQKNNPMKPIVCKNTGHFYLFDSQQISHTKACVEQVSAMQKTNVDEQMSLASGLVLKGLQATTYGDDWIRQGIELADQCFHAWSLMPEELIYLQEKVQTLGALASKVTGAGNGGCILGYFLEKLDETSLPKGCQYLTLPREIEAYT